MDGPFSDGAIKRFAEKMLFEAEGRHTDPGIRIRLATEELKAATTAEASVEILEKYYLTGEVTP